ncbi:MULTISPECIES: 4-hydroxy-tetrahydrodipicolinate reductase [Leuconostoc]|uniref:4-hydroxy-tetrahydrodipicolinate reductase n=1 Tax=Leuconostoc TaxID=1243 RepID=UPI0011BB0B92|nr:MULTISPECIES: 4-hydroxy-tetrahydrodipicolinate reductase [Leuconostoc]QEA45975.1 4-hydroxy-tetrahydrodipicolinate reductase [Leuconostoc citreum]QEA62664.1 4-hydroxy-tetrahydrodipicolinate reductase [Leuconostoc citreum]QOG10421.1 4-hydroxy-tetrahydrodipicolinate reductase [Leuconostoc sp. LN180020]WMS78137.1 4-hydroxy-tetrahydrodipicolinate reductase [Leuconostoc citreum]
MVDIILAGGFGKLGQAIQLGLKNTDYRIVGILSGHQHESTYPVWTTREAIDVKADIFLDVSTPKTVFDNAKWAISHDMLLVVGATGLSDFEVDTLRQTATRGVLIVPNFSLSAVLLMAFAQQAAKYFPDVEIVETHNPKKVDAPSGTAIQTAKLISEARSTTGAKTTEGPARGMRVEDIPVHALRLPGYIAQQSVLFGGTDEQLTLTQSTTSRTAFVPGVLRALVGVQELEGLAIGLDKVL